MPLFRFKFKIRKLIDFVTVGRLGVARSPDLGQMPPQDQGQRGRPCLAVI